MKFATKAIHVGEEPGLASNGDVVVPIHLSTTFARRGVEKPRGGYEYTRTANPTRDALELRLAALEESKHALAFASGLAAEATLVLSLLKKGDHVVAFDDLYGGTRRLFSQTLANFGLDFTYVDAREARNVDRAVSRRTKMIWLESPTNPLLKICDIRAISEVASRHQLNAMRVAEHLEAHSAVAKVIYPGLKSHPQYALGKRQMSGSGGVLSFEVKGTLSDVKRFLRRVKVFSLAESLGGVESLIEHPASMTHASVPGKAREVLGITDRLVRASVGIEDVSDLIEDLDGALD